MKDLSVLLDMIQAQMSAVSHIIDQHKPENYDQSYLKGYKDATQEIVNLVEKINSHIAKGGK
jgi:hypothetical protein